MGVIARLILAGVSKSKIIAKYGKKAYNAVKNDLKKADKEDLKGLAITGAGIATIAAVEGSGIKKKLEKKKGGSVKTYAKGGGVRKPKMTAGY
jgi:hypothetical protein